MTVGRIIASTFILGFGSVVAVFHIGLGVKRLKEEGLKKISIKDLRNIDAIKYETAPAIQLFFIGVACFAMIAYWYFSVFRTF